MKTANQVYQETEDDLAGRNGAKARKQTLLGLVRMQAHSMVDQLTVFGRNGARSINANGSVLLTTR